MKHWSVNIIVNYEIEAETRENAIAYAEEEFEWDTHPSYDVIVEDSWEEEE